MLFATWATYHATKQVTLAQLVFGRDVILKTIGENNWKENNKRKNKLFYGGDVLAKFSNDPYDGPNEIAQVNTYDTDGVS